MRLLTVSTDLGPDATLAQIEATVKGLRVATDVAFEAETNRVRRTAMERMKFPTDDELRSALERLPSQREEESPYYRAHRQLAAREFSLSEGRGFPPELWFDYWYRRRRSSKDDPFFQSLSKAGYDRITSTPFPAVGPVGLDVIDPILYDALVADEVARLMPGRVGVSSLRYGSPFWAWLFGKTTAEKTVSTTVKVLEIARDYGPKRKEAKADAAVAEATVGHKVAESALDVALKGEKLREARLRNERLELENASRRVTLGAEQRRQLLIDWAIQHREMDIADAIRALTPGEAQALAELGHQPLQIEERQEPDETGC